MKRRRHTQLELASARRPVGHGGWRPGAGRARKKGAVSHRARPIALKRHPQHVTMRLASESPAVARGWLMRQVLRPSIAASQRSFFRIVEFNVLSNHVHLIVESDDATTLARGVQGFAIRVARRLNGALNRRGPMWGQRYHARSLRTPAQVRNTIRYVLLNRKHHDAERTFESGWLDPFSSAAWFRGWSGPIRPEVAFNRELLRITPPTAPPQTWLLGEGWRKAGPLSFDDRPA